MDIWAFWEPEITMPPYLKLCVETWRQIPGADIHMLNYRNLWKYIDVDAYGPNLFNGSYHMAQVGDAIRAMLLEKYGGTWFDVDTIIIKPDFAKYLKPEKDIRFFGNTAKKTVHVGYIIVKRPGTLGMINWVAHNKFRIWNIRPNERITWGRLAGDFLEPYAYSHPQEVEILDWHLVHPEEQLKRAEIEDYRRVYEDYFFFESHHRDEIDKEMIVLNNTWTPPFYKNLSRNDLLKVDCTITNLLIETLDIKCPKPTTKPVRK